MLDLELLVAAVVTAGVNHRRRQDVERVVDAERRRHANLALSAHLHGGAAAASQHGRALEGSRGGDQRQHGEKGSKGR